MRIATCNLSVIPLRAEASHRSEMLSQILFAEEFALLEEGKDFNRVRLTHVNYEGWIQKNQCTLQTLQSDVDPHIVDLGGASAIAGNKRIALVHGTALVGNEVLIGTELFRISDILRRPTLDDFAVELPRLRLHYEYAPYLWGGRTTAGIDCSGFSQVVYRHFGLGLPRDAWQQAERGTVVNFNSEIKAGDLAFFDNVEGRITHVGVMLDQDTIMHAAGRVRVDKMDTEGIFNAETNIYTHKLRIVKRYF